MVRCCVAMILAKAPGSPGVLSTRSRHEAAQRRRAGESWWRLCDGARQDCELLVKHGLSDLVLARLSQTLEQFDQAMKHGVEGRRAHIGASADLASVADEVVLLVRVTGGLNRLRFAQDPERLAAWESASSVVAAPHAAGSNVSTEERLAGPELRSAA
jgi:hypothetical protein